MRDQVFISYSHADQRWLEKLQVHLKPFERSNQIQVWDDTKIHAGARGWREEIGPPRVKPSCVRVNGGLSPVAKKFLAFSLESLKKA